MFNTGRKIKADHIEQAIFHLGQIDKYFYGDASLNIESFGLVCAISQTVQLLKLSLKAGLFNLQASDDKGINETT